MKKLIFWASTFLLLLFAVSCEEKDPNGPSGGGDANKPTPEKPSPEKPNKPDEISPETSLVEGLLFTEAAYEIYPYVEFDLRKEVLVFPEEVKDKATIHFYSSDSEIAKVSKEGKVIGKKVGEAVVLAKANGHEVNCKINVKEPTIIESLSLNYTKITIKDSLQLHASFTPNNPTYSKLEWSSSNAEVASVNENGLVTTYKNGDAIITATHKAANKYDKEVSVTCTIKVYTNFTENVNGVSIDMIAVEGGTFQMGATAEQGDDAYDDEYPVHTVNLSSFYLSKTEVTQAQYQAVMGENPSYFKGDNRPVESVSWYDAQAFCEKLSQLTGKNYVLPTEAQWEYAARGGKYQEGTKYAGSNNVDKVAWYDGNSNSQTHPVATKAPNALGLYDMSGNVWEWCADWYGNYSAAAQTNPTGPETGDSRVIRGGGWRNYARYARVSYRFNYNPNRSYFNYGFRVALLP